jgi:hypothetical protein
MIIQKYKQDWQTLSQVNKNKEKTQINKIGNKKDYENIPLNLKNQQKLVINLSREVKVLYNENHTTLKKEIEENISYWKTSKVHVSAASIP